MSKWGKTKTFSLVSVPKGKAYSPNWYFKFILKFQVMKFLITMKPEV